MKKLDYNSMAEKFNSIRMENLGKKFTREDLIRLFSDSGIKAHIINKMIQNTLFFTNGRSGTRIFYCFNHVPVYRSKFEELLFQHQRKTELSKEEQAINYLKSLGYKIYKDKGIDVEALQKQHPDIYKSLVITEEI